MSGGWRWIKWTDEEIRILKKNYQTKTVKEIKTLLPNARSEGAIRGKLRQLGIAKKDRRRPDLAEYNKKRAREGRLNGKNNPFYGKTHSKAFKEYIRKRNFEDNPVYKFGVRAKISEQLKGKRKPQSHREKLSKIAREREIWRLSRNPPYKLEVKFQNICKKHNLPFKYVGDGRYWIGGLNPDFIGSNGDKTIIEVFGNYWHSPLHNPNVKEKAIYEYRKNVFERFGWKVIVLWEDDIVREDAEKYILQKLKKEANVV